jgi:hypothetical protein
MAGVRVLFAVLGANRWVALCPKFPNPISRASLNDLAFATAMIYDSIIEVIA